MSQPLNLTQQQKDERRKELDRLRKQRQRLRERAARVGVVAPSRPVTSVPLGEEFTIRVTPSMPAPVTLEGAAKHQRILDECRALLKAPLSDAELHAKMAAPNLADWRWLPASREEIKEALAAASITLEELRQQGQALGTASRKIAVQHKAELGDIRAEELLREADWSPICKACRYRIHAESLASMSEAELRQRHQELLAVINRPRSFDPAKLPAPVHVEPLPDNARVIPVLDITSGPEMSTQDVIPLVQETPREPERVLEVKDLTLTEIADRGLLPQLITQEKEKQHEPRASNTSSGPTPANNVETDATGRPPRGPVIYQSSGTVANFGRK